MKNSLHLLLIYILLFFNRIISNYVRVLPKKKKGFSYLDFGRAYFEIISRTMREISSMRALAIGSEIDLHRRQKFLAPVAAPQNRDESLIRRG